MRARKSAHKSTDVATDAVAAAGCTCLTCCNGLHTAVHSHRIGCCETCRTHHSDEHHRTWDGFARIGAGSFGSCRTHTEDRTGCIQRWRIHKGNRHANLALDASAGTVVDVAG